MSCHINKQAVAGQFTDLPPYIEMAHRVFCLQFFFVSISCMKQKIHRYDASIRHYKGALFQAIKLKQKYEFTCMQNLKYRVKFIF